MAWSSILVLFMLFALSPMGVILYLKLEILTHCDFSLSFFKIRFSVDFTPPVKENISPQIAEKTLPYIAPHLLKSPQAKKPRRARQSGRQNRQRAADSDKRENA